MQQRILLLSSIMNIIVGYSYIKLNEENERLKEKVNRK